MIRENLSFQNVQSTPLKPNFREYYLPKIIKWSLGYTAGIVLLIGFEYSTDYFEFPSIFIDVAFLLIFLASFFGYSWPIGRLRLGYPNSVVVNDTGIKGEMNYHRKLAYGSRKYLGLITGYAYASLFVIMYFIAILI